MEINTAELQNIVNAAADRAAQQAAQQAIGHPAMTAIPSPSGLFNQARHFVGPYIGSYMGMTAPVMLPDIAPGQGIGEAFYSTRVTARYWGMLQEQLVKQMSEGLSRDLGAIAGNLGAHRLLGIKEKDFRDILSRGAATSAGQMVTSFLLSNRSVQNILGGDILGAYQHMFAHRHLFGGTGSTLDRDLQNKNALILSDTFTELLRAIRGDAYGRLGAVQNVGFTRGFRDEQIVQFMVAAKQAGAWAGSGDLLMQLSREHPDLDFKADPRYEAVIKKMVNETGSIARMFEALGDLIGSRETDDLLNAINKLTHGRWADRNNMGQMAENIRISLRQIEGLAQTLSMSKGLMFQTMLNVQEGLSMGVGVGPNQIASGFYGGSYTGIEAIRGTISRSAAVVRSMNLDMSSEAGQRVFNQQMQLETLGVASSAGRALQLIQYYYETGSLDKATYDRVVAAYMSGTMQERLAAVKEAFIRGAGSVSEGFRQMNDPITMAHVRERTKGGAAVNELIARGQMNEATKRSVEFSHRAIESSLAGARETFGTTRVIYNRDSDYWRRQADAFRQALILPEGHPHKGLAASGIELFNEVYSQAISKGASAQDAFNRAKNAVRSIEGIDAYYSNAEMAAKKAGLLYESEATLRYLPDLAEFKGISSVISSNYSSLTDQQRKEFTEILRLKDTSPSEANARLKAFVSQLPSGLRKAAMESGAASLDRAKSIRANIQGTLLANRVFEDVGQNFYMFGRLSDSIDEYGRALIDYSRDRSDTNLQRLRAIAERGFGKNLADEFIKLAQTDPNAALAAHGQLTKQRDLQRAQFDRRFSALGLSKFAAERAAAGLSYDQLEISANFAAMFNQALSTGEAITRSPMGQKIMAALMGHIGLSEAIGVEDMAKSSTLTGIFNRYLSDNVVQNAVKNAKGSYEMLQREFQNLPDEAKKLLFNKIGELPSMTSKDFIDLQNQLGALGVSNDFLNNLEKYYKNMVIVRGRATEAAAAIEGKMPQITVEDRIARTPRNARISRAENYFNILSSMGYQGFDFVSEYLTGGKEFSDRELNEFVKVVLPDMKNATKEEKVKAVITKLGDRESFYQLNDEQQKQALKLMKTFLEQKKKAEGEAGGGYSKITGTLTLVDSEGNRKGRATLAGTLIQ